MKQRHKKMRLIARMMAFLLLLTGVFPYMTAVAKAEDTPIKRTTTYADVTIGELTVTDNALNFVMSAATDTALSDMMKEDAEPKIVGYYINGQLFPNRPAGQPRDDLFLVEKEIRTQRSEAKQAFLADKPNVCGLIFSDGTVLQNIAETEQPSNITDEQIRGLLTPEAPADEVPLFELKNAVLQDGYGYSEFLLEFTADDIYFNPDFEKFKAAIDSYKINGVEFKPTDEKPYFELDFDGLLADDLDLIEAVNKKQPPEVIITLKDGRETALNKEIVEEVETVPLTDDLADGEYTIGFRALRADGKPGSSMLEGFFDRNIHLTVENGKYKIEMLNLFFADGLYDFRIKTADGFPESQKMDFGEPNKDGKYTQAIFTLPIDDVQNNHEGRVLVGYMGSSPADKGKIESYTPLTIQFKGDAVVGWQGYYNPKQMERKRQQSADVLRRRLIQSGVDKNNDTIITPDELASFEGIIDISGTNATERIYNIDLLKDMGPGVKALRAAGNKIEALPEGLLDNATGITEIDLRGNEIPEIPEHFFDKATALVDLQLSANPLGRLPKDMLTNNGALKRLTLTDTKLSEIPEGFLNAQSQLEKLHLSDNKFVNMPDSLFAATPALKWLYIDNNQLIKLPTSTKDLKQLERLYASFNHLETLPEGMENLTALTEVVLSENNLKEIPTAIFTALAKNTSDDVRTSIKIDRNNLTAIPAEEIIAAGGIKRMDAALNYLPAELPYTEEQYKALGIFPTSQAGYFPQKTEVALDIKAENGEITVNRDLDILSTTFWWIGGDLKSLGGEGVSQSRIAFDAYAAKKMTNGIADYMRERKGYTWRIETKVERLTPDGGSVPVAFTEDTETEDAKTFTATDNRMQVGDVYEVTKTMIRQHGTGGEYEPMFSVKARTTALTAATGEKNVQPVEGKLMKADGSETESMAAKALVNPIQRVETVGEDMVEYEVSFQGIELFNLTGHLIKLYQYDDNNVMTEVPILKMKGGFPETFLLKAAPDKTRLKLRVRVDAMEEIASNNENYTPGDGEQDVYLDLRLRPEEDAYTATDANNGATVTVKTADMVNPGVAHPDEWVFHCTPVTDADTVKRIASKPELANKEVLLYEMQLLHNGEPVAFKKANVQVPLANTFANRKADLYYIDDAEALQKLYEVQIGADGKAALDVEHFSLYALVLDKTVQPEEPPKPEEPVQPEDPGKPENPTKPIDSDNNNNVTNQGAKGKMPNTAAAGMQLLGLGFCLAIIPLTLKSRRR
ncbi:MAG: NEAT domain-containing protein [Tissierellia bacterium]|nr:NEAT domain-containing protein [Tissierellia bacterium]